MNPATTIIAFGTKSHEHSQSARYNSALAHTHPLSSMHTHQVNHERNAVWRYQFIVGTGFWLFIQYAEGMGGSDYVQREVR